jgi:hypothetical protein
LSSIALVHDYLTQRGGAERVVIALTRAFPEAPLHTSLYEPATTFPEFAAVDVHPLPLNRLAPLRHRHRLALPLLAPAFSRLHLEQDVVICSSSGWAQGAHVAGRKIPGKPRDAASRSCHAEVRTVTTSREPNSARTSSGTAIGSIRISRSPSSIAYAETGPSHSGCVAIQWYTPSGSTLGC